MHHHALDGRRDVRGPILAKANSPIDSEANGSFEHLVAMPSAFDADQNS
jgi:hypothetical protein